MTDRYLVAGCTPWARRVFEQTLSKLPGEWGYVEDQEALVQWARVGFAQAAREAPPPAYIFFLHWRWKVPASIVNKCECVGFHLGKLPNERGGSPLQWRILTGAPRATLTMFRMSEGLDEGRILAEEDVTLHGAAEAVYARAMERAAGMIEDFLKAPGEGWEQQGHALAYRRRVPADSRLPDALEGLTDAYDRIRMMDAEGYPRAFLEYGGLRFEFERAVLYDGRIKADVVITEVVQGG